VTELPEQTPDGAVPPDPQGEPEAVQQQPVAGGDADGEPAQGEGRPDSH
jgi:hypothetical protein